MHHLCRVILNKVGFLDACRAGILRATVVCWFGRTFSAVHTVGTITYKASDARLHAAEMAVTASTTRSDGSTRTLNGAIKLVATQQGSKLKHQPSTVGGHPWQQRGD